jgi:L-seryl-tRNA(Ser) seleniumtransferase
MLRMKADELTRRAESIIAQLRDLPLKAEVGEGRAQLGGGTLPKAVVPSVTIDLAPRELPLAELGRRLRRGKPPVMGYVAGQRYKIDLRTVFPRQDLELAQAIRKAFTVKE